MSDATWVIQLVQSIGFPAAVAGFVLLRLEARMKELSAAIQSLREVVVIVATAVNPDAANKVLAALRESRP